MDLALGVGVAGEDRMCEFERIGGSLFHVMKAETAGISDMGTGWPMAYPARVSPLAGRGNRERTRRQLFADNPGDLERGKWLDMTLMSRFDCVGIKASFHEDLRGDRPITIKAARVQSGRNRACLEVVVDLHPLFWKIPPDIREEIITQHEVFHLAKTADGEDAVRRKTLAYLKDNLMRAMRHLCWFAANGYGIRLEGGFRRQIEEGIKDYFIRAEWREFFAGEIEIASGAMFEALGRLPELNDRHVGRARLAIKRALSVFLFDGTFPARKG